MSREAVLEKSKEKIGAATNVVGYRKNTRFTKTPMRVSSSPFYNAALDRALFPCSSSIQEAIPPSFPPSLPLLLCLCQLLALSPFPALFWHSQNDKQKKEKNVNRIWEIGIWEIGIPVLICLILSSAPSFRFLDVDKFDHSSSSAGGSFVLSRLRKHCQYEVVVQAINIYGEGPLSRPSLGRTMEDGEN